MWLMTMKLQFPNIIDEKGQPLTIVNANSVDINSSYKQLTDTATIILPRNADLFKKYSIRELFKADDPVLIELGYDEQNEHEFEGYIAHVSADIPVVIKCENEMRKVKALPVNYSNKSVTLEKLLKDICPGYEIDALEGVALGSVRFPKTTVGKVLEKLQTDSNLYTYMKGKQIVCGKYYADDSAIEAVEFDLERAVVENSLQYKNKEDVVLKISASSLLVNGQKLEFEFGEEGGDVMKLSYFNITAKAELEKKVKEDYAKAHRDGWDGTITVFGKPRMQHGMKVTLYSELYPDRNGTYYVDGVSKKFDENGYRQVITLGGKVS